MSKPSFSSGSFNDAVFFRYYLENSGKSGARTRQHWISATFSGLSTTKKLFFGSTTYFNAMRVKHDFASFAFSQSSSYNTNTVMPLDIVLYQSCVDVQRA